MRTTYAVMAERSAYFRPECTGSYDTCYAHFQGMVIEGAEGGVYICEYTADEKGNLIELVEAVQYQSPIRVAFP